MKKLLKNKMLILMIVLINLLLFFNVYPYLVNIVKFIIKLLIPFIIGFTIAFILLPIVNFMVKKKVKRELAVGIVVISFIGIVVLIGYLLIPVIVSEIYKIIEKIPDYIILLENKMDYIEDKLSFLSVDLFPNRDNLEEVIMNYLSNFLNVSLSIVKNGMNYIFNFLLSIILMIYFLIDFDKIIRWVKEVSSKFKKVNLEEYLIEIKYTMQAYFKGIVLTTMILIVISFILFTVFEIDYALILACLIGITDIIPYVGPYIGGSFACLVALTESIDKAIIVLIIVVILQGLESWLITPKIQSKSIKVHPIVVLFSLILFGSLFGIMGMLVAVPVVAIIQTTIKRYLIV